MRKLINRAIIISFSAILFSANSAIALESKAEIVEVTADNKSPRELAEDWIFEFLVKHAEPGRKLWYHNAQETREEAVDRYKSIAKDIVSVVWSPNFKPIFKDKDNGRSRTASVILGIMLHESGFRKDVDLNLGKHSKGDNGQSWCMMQLMIGKGNTIHWNFVKDRMYRNGDPTEELFTGYSGDELIADRTKCISEGYKIIRSSFGSCWKLPLTEKLTSYASGVCEESDDPKLQAKFEAGKEKSRIRMGTALRWFEKTKNSRGFNDADVVSSFQQN
jgi:hypothetical protein